MGHRRIAVPPGGSQRAREWALVGNRWSARSARRVTTRSGRRYMIGIRARAVEVRTERLQEAIDLGGGSTMRSSVCRAASNHSQPSVGDPARSASASPIRSGIPRASPVLQARHDLEVVPGVRVDTDAVALRLHAGGGEGGRSPRRRGSTLPVSSGTPRCRCEHPVRGPASFSVSRRCGAHRLVPVALPKRPVSVTFGEVWSQPSRRDGGQLQLAHSAHPDLATPVRRGTPTTTAPRPEVNASASSLYPHGPGRGRPQEEDHPPYRPHRPRLVTSVACDRRVVASLYDHRVAAFRASVCHVRTAVRPGYGPAAGTP